MADDSTKSQEELRKEYDSLKSDLGKLREDFGTLVGALGQYNKERAGDVRDRARNEMDELMDRLNEGYGQARSSARGAFQRAQHGVEENAMTSLLVSFGAGLLFGMLFSKR